MRCGSRFAALCQWYDRQSAYGLLQLRMPAAECPGYGADGRKLVKTFAAAIRSEGESGYRVDDAIRTLQIVKAARVGRERSHY